MRKSIVLVVAVVAAATVMAAGYFGFQSAAPDESAVPAAPITIAVSRGDVEQTVTAPGLVLGTLEMALSMDVGGRLVELRVRPGSSVKAGDVLATLDPVPYR